MAGRRLSHGLFLAGFCVVTCLGASVARGDFAQAFLSNAFTVWSAPYDAAGEGVNIGSWAAGIPSAFHPNLQGQLVIREGGATTTHATHVAGCMVGLGANPTDPTLTRGISHQATLIAYNSTNAVSEFSSAALTDDVVVANNSWNNFIGWHFTVISPPWTDFGGQEEFGAYTAQTRDIDQVVFQLDQMDRTFVAVFTTGDDRNEGPSGATAGFGDGVFYPEYDDDFPFFDCVDPVATGKNTLGVGAVFYTLTTPFSGWGPADDGRIKPDLVAHGQNIYNSINTPELWGNLSGTEHAVPVVSGAAATVIEYFERNTGARPSTATVKSLLINGAQDAGNPGPDAAFGFGLVDIKAALDTILADEGAGRTIKTGTIANGQTLGYNMRVTDADKPIKVTLTWIDPPGVAFSPTPLVNNVDLRLMDPDGFFSFPFKLNAANPLALATSNSPNTVDTVEQIVVEAPKVGLWRLEVLGTNIPSGPQKFALASNTPLNDGALEPTNVTFARHGDGQSVVVNWNPDPDPDLSEYRLFRSSAIGTELELLDILPPGSTSYVDFTAPAGGTTGYDLRAVFDYAGVREVSERAFGLQVPNPRIVTPADGASVPSPGLTRIIGFVDLPFGQVRFLEGPGSTELGMVNANGGIFHLDYGFQVGSFDVRVQVTASGLGISIPSLDTSLTAGP